MQGGCGGPRTVGRNGWRRPAFLVVRRHLVMALDFSTSRAGLLVSAARIARVCTDMPPSEMVCAANLPPGEPVDVLTVMTQKSNPLNLVLFGTGTYFW